MIKIKTSRKEQEKIDRIQPYVRHNGKLIKNDKFEKFYGSVDKAGKRPDSKQDIDWERVNAKKREARQ